MYRVILILFLLSYAFVTKGQNANLLWKDINNETIDYNVISRQKKYTTDKVVLPTFLIKVNKTSRDSLIIENMTQDEWLKALKDPATDWAANLLLYEYYKRSGLVFLKCSMSHWKKNLKQDHLEYWQKVLAAKGVQ